jgi:hypothetical protein
MLANGPVCNQPGFMRERRNSRVRLSFNRAAKKR